MYSKKRIAGNRNGSIRIEEMDIYPYQKMLVKKCSFGRKSKIFGKEIVDLKNTMYSTIDCETGKLIQHGSSNLSPFGDWMSAGLETEPLKDRVYLDENCPFYEATDLNDCFTSGYDMNSVKADIYANEDVLQMAYSECVGLLTSFFSQWNYGIPTDSFIIIDACKGVFNVPKFTYLNIVDREQGKKMYAYYIKHISEMVELLSRNCELSGKKLRILVFNSVYTTVIKIKDLENKGLNLRYSLNASDHFSSIVHNVESLSGDKWSMSEESGVILKPDMGKVSDSMIYSYYMNSPLEKFNL